MDSIKRILVFDDDPTIVSIMKYILEQKGWVVMTKAKCENAIREITNFNPSVILMDNKIPDSGGVYAIQLIKQQEQLRHIPVILFTGHPDIKVLARQAGADAYLEKPFGLDNLYKVIDDLLVA